MWGEGSRTWPHEISPLNYRTEKAKFKNIKTFLERRNVHCKSSGAKSLALAVL